MKTVMDSIPSAERLSDAAYRAVLEALFDRRVAAGAFVSAYLERLAERGETAGTGAGIARRAPVFEAALLLKIAARRVNRLHSPRPGEVTAVLDEVCRSLALAGLSRPGSAP